MKRVCVTLLACITSLQAQTQIHGGQQIRNADWSSMPYTKPVKVGSALPATCSAGEMFWLSTATPGANLHGCVSANTWMALASSSGGSGGVADPGANGVMKRTALNTTAPATAADLATVQHCTAGGATNAYSCSLSPAITSYTTGACYGFAANLANTGAATVSFNALGARSIKKHGNVDLISGDIKAAQIVRVCFDGTNMQLQSQLGNIPVTTAAGDAAGPLDALTVGALQGRTVYGAAPSSNQVLKWDAANTRWAPATDSIGAPGYGVTLASETFAVDSAVIPAYSIGTSAPSGSCVAGRDFFVNTATGILYFCKATDTWQSATGAAPENSSLLLAFWETSGMGQGLTRYIAPGAVSGHATETSRQFLMVRSGTLRNLGVNVIGSIASAETLTVSVRKNAADTGITCVVTGPAQTCTDLANSVSFSSGDLLSFKLVTSSATGAAIYPLVQVETQW
ncbi:MAG: hypothetical protein J0L64_09180 [Acidobacteria bacterium]|nr:hypothetical protein [Acidobacteriota bacterium]